MGTSASALAEEFTSRQGALQETFLAFATRGVPLPPEQVECGRRNAVKFNLGRAFSLSLDGPGGQWPGERIRRGTNASAVILHS
jgi:hypothetical protein